MTRVIGRYIASTRPRMATAVDFPACLQQLSKICGCSVCKTSSCHGSGSSPNLRMSVTVGGRSAMGGGRSMANSHESTELGAEPDQPRFLRIGHNAWKYRIPDQM